MRAKRRIPRSNYTGLNDLLVWSTPKLDRTPNAGRAAKTPASPGCSPRENSWSQTPMVSLQRTLLNHYLARHPVDVVDANSVSGRPIFNLALLSIGLTLPREPGYEAPFQRRREVRQQFSWYMSHLSIVIPYGYILVKFRNSNSTSLNS